jgi:nitrite reductase/ring-hydroxylating ferredoxin subunit
MAWTAAATCAQFGDRDVIAVECAGRRLALYRWHGGVYATSDVCPHQGASLSDGCLVSGYIECPVHFALFNIQTGESDGSVTAARVATFPAKIEGDVIYVDLTGMKETAQ